MAFPARGEFVKVGKGSFLLDMYDNSNGQLTGKKFMGNATSGELTPTITNIELYSSTQRSAGLVARDKNRVLYVFTLALSEFTLENLKLFTLAEKASRAQDVATSQPFVIDSVVVGDYYEVAGKRRVTLDSVIVGSNPLVAGVDYEFSSEFGVIRFLPSSLLVQDDDEVVITYDAPALQIDVLRIGKDTKQIGHLLYLSDDVNQDGRSAHDRIEIWRLDIAPDGAMNVISDEYGGFTITMAVLDDGANHPNDPYGTWERIHSEGA